MKELEEKLINMAISTLGISYSQAKLRIEALIKSEVLKGLNPSDVKFQITVDVAMQIPQLKE